MTNEIDMKKVLKDLEHLSPVGVAMIRSDMRERLKQAVLHVEMLRQAAEDLGVTELSPEPEEQLYEAKRLVPPEERGDNPIQTIKKRAKRTKLPKPTRASKYRNPTKEVIAHAQRLVSARGKITSVDLLAELKRRFPSRVNPYWPNTLRRILLKCIASAKPLIPGVVVTKYNHRVFTLAPAK